MQKILYLLQFNLFEKRDLLALLRGDPPIDQREANKQLVLLWKLTGQQWSEVLVVAAKTIGEIIPYQYAPQDEYSAYIAGYFHF